MIRPIFTEIALFLAPFAVYALYLWVTRATVLSRVVVERARWFRGSPSLRSC